MYLIKDKKIIEEVIKLYKKEIYQFSFIGSVLTNLQKGKIYINNKNNLTCAFIIHKFGWAQIIGNEDKNFIEKLNSKILENKFNQKIRLFNWNSKILKLTDTITGKRIQYDFNKLIKSELINNKFNISKINQKNFFQVSKQCKLELNKRFWASKKDFFKNSFGFFAKKNSRIVAVCYSCANYGLHREIDVFTEKKYRKLGLAKLLSSKFILECKQRGLKPKWDCYQNNFSSNKLAKSLGFKNYSKPYNFSIYK